MKKGNLLSAYERFFNFQSTSFYRSAMRWLLRLQPTTEQSYSTRSVASLAGRTRDPSSALSNDENEEKLNKIMLGLKGKNGWDSFILPHTSSVQSVVIDPVFYFKGKPFFYSNDKKKWWISFLLPPPPPPPPPPPEEEMWDKSACGTVVLVS